MKEEGSRGEPMNNPCAWRYCRARRVGGWVGVVVMCGGMTGGHLCAQPAPSPSGTATPWVQAPPASDKAVPSPTAVPSASPAPKIVGTPTPANTPTPKPVASTPAPAATGPSPAKPAPGPKPAPVVHPPPTAEETKVRMQRERERELEQASEQEQLLPDEQTKFKENLGVWRKLPPEQREAIRERAEERIRAETDAAYAESGLNLNDDQREVFDLRYKQERRRLERELQERTRLERSRRLPQIMEGLKREFARASVPVATPKPSPAPNVMPVPTPTPSPAGTPTPAKA